MNKNEEKRDQLIRETFDQCLSGIDELPSLRANILAKAKTRSLKWEPIRFRIPAIAMCLVLVLAFGFLAGTGRLSLSASPDEIRGGSQYTVQPIEASLTEGGQNTVQEDGSPSPDTVLYYVPDRGSMYHIDPNCRSVDSQFKPLQGMFTYADLNKEPYSSLERCNVCAAPLRKAEAGEAESSVADQLASLFPDLQEGLKPLNLSAESEDIRLNVVAGQDRNGYITLLYTLEDLTDKWFRDGDCIDVAPTFLQPDQFASFTGQVRQETISGTHTKAGIAYMMTYGQLQSGDTFPFTITNLSLWDTNEELSASSNSLVEYVDGPWTVEIPVSALQSDERAVEKESGERPVKVSMELSKDHVSLWDDINVLISVTNTTDEDLPGVMELYDVDGIRVPDEEDFTLATGETRSWYLPWDISEDDLASEKITYSIKYHTYDGPADESGTPTLKEHKINFSKRIYPVSGSDTGEQLSFLVPGVENELKPLNLSTEQQGLRVDLVSGLVQKSNAWFVYKLHDPDISEETTLRYDYFMKNSRINKFHFSRCSLDEHASEHTYTDTFETENDGEPIASLAENGILTIGIENPVFYQNRNADLLPLLKEYGTVSDGILAPSQAESGPQVYGGPNLPDISLGAVVLDYTNPLNIPLCPDVDLTAIGFINNCLHVQFHYTGNQPFLRAGNNMCPWEAGCSCIVAPDSENLPWTTIVWDDNDDDCCDWMEFVWDCTFDTAISELSANFYLPAKVKPGSWTFDVPLSSVTTDELVMTEEQDTSLQADMDSESFISVIMMLEKNNILPGETIDVGLTLFNGSTYKLLAGPVKLYDPSGKKIIDYQIDERDEIYWNGVCTVTREMLLDGKLTFTMEYPAWDGPAGEDGKPTLKEHTIHFSREIYWPCIDDETAAELEKLPTNERAKAILERSYPDFARDLKPLNISCEDQGLRITVDYGVIKGEQGCFIWTLEDPEGKIIKEGLDPYVDFNFLDDDLCYEINGDYQFPCVNYEKRTASFGEVFKIDDSLLTDQRSIGAYFIGPLNKLNENADLTALLRHYGKVKEGVKMPENARSFQYRIYSENAPQPPAIRDNLKVLDYTRPMNTPLARDTVLTGIGWIDNQLHIQVHYTGDDADFPYEQYNFMEKWSVYLNADNFEGSLPYLIIDWDEDYNGMTDWREFVLNCSPDDVNQLSLEAQCSLIVDTVIGNWSVNIPLSDILVDETSQDLTRPEPTPTQDPPVTEAYTSEIPAGIGEPLQISSRLLQIKGNKYTNSDGVQISLTSGIVKENTADFVYTITDPNGRILTPDNYKNALPCAILIDRSGPIYPSDISLCDWNEAEHTASYWAEFYSDNPILPMENGSLELEVSNGKINYIGLYPADLLPLLKEYGKTFEKGMLLPEKTGTISAYPSGKPELSPKGKELLDNSDPLNIPLDEGLFLTGIGWLGNKLHIQIHSTEGIYDLNNGSSAFCRCVVSGIDIDSTSASISWNDDPDDPNRNDWLECVLDCAPEEKDFIEDLTFSTTPANRDLHYVNTRYFKIPFKSVQAD